MIRATAALIVSLVLGSAAAMAETAFEMTFRSGTLDAFDAGDELRYQSIVSGTRGDEEVRAMVAVRLSEDGVAALEQSEAGDTERPLGRFDASVGNPVAMFFLERTIRTIAEATGGSGFYLRNRIKDALRAPEQVQTVEVDWNGERIEATEVVLAPFDLDPNRARLGRFGDLRIRLVMGEDVPGWYYALRADAEGFGSTLSLAEVDG